MAEIFNSVLKMSVDASYLIAAVIIARFLLRKSSKVFRKVLWTLVGLRLVIPFSFESGLSLVPQEGVIGSSQMFANGNATVAPVEPLITDSFDIERLVPCLWIAVGAALSLYGLISFIKLKRKVSDAVLLRDRIYQSEKVDSPFVCGFLKPKIYIPYSMDGDTLDCVLKHENTHIKYLDHILKAIGFAVLCVHWFNPLVWVGYILFCKDIELLCDEIVVKNMTDENRHKYAVALCNIGIENIKISACPVAFGEVGIKERIKNTVNYKQAKLLVVIISAVACLAVAVCFMTTPAEAQDGNAEPKPDEAVAVVETTIPETVPATEIPETTEPVTENVTETTTEPYVEEVDAEAEMPSLDVEEMKRQRELAEELDSFRSRKEAEKNNKGYNSISSIIGDTNSRNVNLPTIAWDPPSVGKTPNANSGPQRNF